MQEVVERSESVQFDLGVATTCAVRVAEGFHKFAAVARRHARVRIGDPQPRAHVSLKYRADHG